MRLKFILGIILCVGGFGLFLFSDYISKEVAIGQGKIERGQKQVDGINSFFKSTTQSDTLGDFVTGSAQKKIDRGNREVQYYDKLSGELKIAAVIAVLAGIAFFFFARRKPRT